jgi:hypothetical protein
MKPIKWDTLLRSKKALPRAWDQLPVEVRRHCFVDKTEKHLSWCCFKLWKLLTPKEQSQIKEKLHYKKDVIKICKNIQKYLKQENNMKKHSTKPEASDSSASDSSSKTTKKHSSKKTTPVKKAKTKTTKKVVPIVDALKVDCPKCKVHKGHRCVRTTGSGKRDNPHRARIQKAMKLAPKKKAA